ncbi:MAG: DUF4166 domain-containing protein [Hyphomicrobiaceae bacterium]
MRSPDDDAGPFAALLGADAWHRLPPEVRARFGGEPHEPDATLYSGRVAATRLTWPGRLLARAAALLGTPLPDTDGATGAAVVSVTAAPELGGQLWTRIYRRAGRFPQVVHSVKRFAGPTGLEEYVGRGIGMALRLTVEDGALVFSSDHYFIALPRTQWRWRLPRWLEPGRMRIVHRQIEAHRFQFTLDLEHPLAGLLIHQDCLFEDVVPDLGRSHPGRAAADATPID